MYGFETVHPASMTFAEQREVFGNAAIIAGESGAAMTNIVLAPQSTVMFVMQAQKWPLNIYADLASYGGQRNIFMAGDLTVGGPIQTYQASFTIDPSKLRGVMTDILEDI